MKDSPLYISERELREFARYEITYEEMTGGNSDCYYEGYEVTLKDLIACFKNMKKKNLTCRGFLDGWFSHVFYDLYSELYFNKRELSPANRFITYESLEEIFFCFWEWCKYVRDIKFKNDPDSAPDYSQIIKTLETYEKNIGLDFDDRKYTLPMKYSLVFRVGNPSKVDEADARFRKLYKKFVNDLCKADIVFGYRVKGYSHLTGTSCFKESKDKALQMFLKIYTETEDAYITDIIGDLYYGGTETLEPFYEMAYQYYTISALNGNQTSMLKVSDMLCRGRGTVRSEHVGKMMVFNLFDEAYRDFCRYNPESLLPDVTVRMGMIFDTGIDTKVDKLEACKFYNIARYSLKKRIRKSHNPADEMLLEDISHRCRELNREIGTNPNVSFVFSEVPNMFLSCLVENYEVSVVITKEDNEFMMVSRRIAKINEDRPMGVLVEYPLNEYCALLDEVVEFMPLKGTQIWIKERGVNTFDADEMSYVKDAKQCVFRRKGKIVAKITTSMFSCKLKSEEL